MRFEPGFEALPSLAGSWTRCCQAPPFFLLFYGQTMPSMVDDGKIEPGQTAGKPLAFQLMPCFHIHAGGQLLWFGFVSYTGFL